MKISCFEHDPGFVLERFRQGEFDHLESASEVGETEFFRHIGSENILKELAQTYPSPRKKHEVPVWFYLASNLSMRLHGEHSFNAYPALVRCGGMLNAFGHDIGHKVRHPHTGEVTLSCAGFNEKNEFDRQTPCDQDYLRKFAKATDAGRLMTWFNTDVARILRSHNALDPDGICIADASFLFVPDNPKYEGSVRMLFDENDHPVDPERFKRMTPAQAAQCAQRRCYKLVSILHTDAKGSFFLRLAARVVPGNAHEAPVLYDLLEEVVAAIPGAIKRLILDRGFLDGEKIGRCKSVHGIDVLIPFRHSMDLYKDALGLLKLEEAPFREAPLQPGLSPAAPRLTQLTERIRRREAKRQETLAKKKGLQPPPPASVTRVRSEVAGLSQLTSFEQCPVPLSVIVNRETFADGKQEYWMLLDTRPLEGPEAAAARRQEYHLRVAIEEGHRQLKCFWDLTRFRSRAFSLVANQVVFVLLGYNLLQLYLKAKGREDLNRRTLPTVQKQLLPNDSFIIIYCQNRFARLSNYEYTEILLTLSPQAAAKVLSKARQRQRELAKELRSPRRLKS